MCFLRAVFFVTRATNSLENNNYSPHSLAAAFPYGGISMKMLFVNKGFLTVQQITTSLLIHFGQVLWMLNEDSSLITVKKILLVTLPTQGTMHFWIWTGFNIQSKCLLQPLALHFLLLMFCKWVELPSWTYILQSLQSFGNDNFVVNGKCSLNLMSEKNLEGHQGGCQVKRYRICKGTWNLEKEVRDVINDTCSVGTNKSLC